MADHPALRSLSSCQAWAVGDGALGPAAQHQTHLEERSWLPFRTHHLSGPRRAKERAAEAEQPPAD